MWLYCISASRCSPKYISLQMQSKVYVRLLRISGYSNPDITGWLYCASGKHFVIVVISWPSLVHIFLQSKCNVKHYWSNKWMSWVLSSLPDCSMDTQCNIIIITTQNTWHTLWFDLHRKQDISILSVSICGCLPKLNIHLF